MNNIQEKLNQIKAKATTKKALRLHFDPTLNPELASSARSPTLYFSQKTPTKSAWDESPSKTMILDGFDLLYTS